MPYSIRKRNDKYAVVNTDTGKTKGTHSTKKAAERQRRALYAAKNR